MTHASHSTQAAAGTAPRETIAYALHGNCYLNLTSRCTLRCAFCPKFNGEWAVQGYPLRLRHEPDAEEVLEAVGDPRPFREIVFCGLGEPTRRLTVLLAVAARLRAAGAARIRVNCDGQANRFHGRDVTPQFAGLVDALSISLNAHNEALYERHCRPRGPGAWPALLDFTRRAREQVPEVTLTAIDGLEGVDIEACARLAADLGVGFRRRVLDEVG